MSEKDNLILTNDELDVIGEIMNISMGSAATAISTMLDKQSSITTPRLEQGEFSSMDCSNLEPAIVVKIEYVEGLEGVNTTIIGKKDMQVIVNILMGNEPDYVDEDFEFDEMSMSAACEVMNQMMGSSATALSKIIGRTVNISTPEAILVDNIIEGTQQFVNLAKDSEVIAISFILSITDVLETTFTSFLPASFAKVLVDIVMNDMNGEDEATIQEPVAPTPQPAMQQPMMQQPVAPTPQPAMQQPMMQQPMTPTSQPVMQQPMMQQSMMQQPMMQQSMVQQPSANVQVADFPNFGNLMGVTMSPGSNMDVLMGVQLEITVVIGRTKRKIKDIMEFGQGSVIELDQQTGAPAEIMVNGQLLAYGDVIVVDDNFGVRVTEIVGSADLLNSLEKGK